MTQDILVAFISALGWTVSLVVDYIIFLSHLITGKPNITGDANIVLVCDILMVSL